eukprot:2277874-Prymnesium_polylepis.1
MAPLMTLCGLATSAAASDSGGRLAFMSGARGRRGGIELGRLGEASVAVDGAWRAGMRCAQQLAS